LAIQSSESILLKLKKLSPKNLYKLVGLIPNL
jgi:hypothetical protein